jgi:hypothetical protein
MDTFFSKLSRELDEQLQFIQAEFDHNQKRAEESYLVLEKAYARLHSFVLKYKFKSRSEEIFYFKTLKPKISAKLIYFLKVYHIETKKPQGSNKAKKKYLQNELHKINDYFEENIDFIRYYRSNESYLDHLYFVRDKIDFKRSPETFSIELDRKQGTSFDYKIAKIMANDLLQVYLHEELRMLELLETQELKPEAPLPKLAWTESKTAMIELIYAIQVSGALNNGKAEIKDIAELCERLFDVKLGDYYRTFLELRMRKTGRTKFLDNLKEQLIRRMDDQDDRIAERY